MKTQFVDRVGSALAALALLVGAAACDSNSNNAQTDQTLDREIAASVAFVSNDLGFDASETVALKSAFDESDDYAHEPGFLWQVAARLQANLTDEQRARLMNRFEANGAVFGAPGFHFGLEPGFGDHFQDRPGFGPFGRLAAVHAFADYLGLTDDQKEAIRGILSDARDAMHELHVQHLDGTLTDEAFRDALQQLMDDTKTAWEALLTDDQLALLEQLKAEREAAIEERQQMIEEERAAARAVMIEVLGLSDEQVAALEALEQKVADLRDTFQEMIDAGATRDEIKVWAEEARAEVTAELVGILDQTQLEIFLIHGALESRVGMRFREMRQNGGMGPMGGMGQRGPH